MFSLNIEELKYQVPLPGLPGRAPFLRIMEFLIMKDDTDEVFHVAWAEGYLHKTSPDKEEAIDEIITEIQIAYVTLSLQLQKNGKLDKESEELFNCIVGLEEDVAEEALN